MIIYWGNSPANTALFLISRNIALKLAQHSYNVSRLSIIREVDNLEIKQYRAHLFNHGEDLDPPASRTRRTNGRRIRPAEPRMKPDSRSVSRGICILIGTCHREFNFLTTVVKFQMG